MNRLDIYQEYQAPEWDDLPIETTDEDLALDARKDALRESFKAFQDGPAPNLQRNMLTGNATPGMLRDAVRRLTNMLQISGEVGDYRTEADIVHALAGISTVARRTIYE
ncbi:hypothetical protein WS50_12760 [Burkholderia territorii]|uniref:hypothetical protein n=1 Tax=Burkholderia territorii TaxID=1503055 RepID=UPI00075A1015|nr:hypothetical protein [Burkholderia territorii]KUZ03036.1 hypothetical protein WS47_30615 [Burkholderia territorii]KUZ17646.1 hypothetical protein WS50_12760 [Burkholderia territorii]